MVLLKMTENEVLIEKLIKREDTIKPVLVHKMLKTANTKSTENE